MFNIHIHAYINEFNKGSGQKKECSLTSLEYNGKPHIFDNQKILGSNVHLCEFGQLSFTLQFLHLKDEISFHFLIWLLQGLNEIIYT